MQEKSQNVNVGAPNMTANAAAQKYFPKNSFQQVQDALKDLGPQQVGLLVSTSKLQSPTTLVVVSFLLGGLGVDRFMLSQAMLGILKLVTLGGFGLWWFLDLFLIGNETRKANLAKLASVITYAAIKPTSTETKGFSTELSHDELDEQALNRQSTQGSIHSGTAAFHASQIQSMGTQAMESIYIIATSKSLDTIQGRHEFLSKIIETLRTHSRDPGYNLEIQKAVDNFKRLHYNSTPTGYQMSVVLYPKEFDLVDFYCKALAVSFSRYYEDQLSAISKLKMDDAKDRRWSKVKEVLDSTIAEQRMYCTSAQSYDEIMTVLEQIRQDVSSSATEKLLSFSYPEFV